MGAYRTRFARVEFFAFDPKATWGRSAIEPVGCIYRRAAHPLLGESGRICKSGCGEIDNQSSICCPIGCAGFGFDRV